MNPLAGKIEISHKIQTCFFNQCVTSTHLLWDCWCIHGLKLWNLVSFWSFLFLALQLENGCVVKVVKFHYKRRQYFWINCVESNLIFYIKKILSFLKVLDIQILEELINLRLKCSFLSLVQVTPQEEARVQVTPFYSSYILIIENLLLIILCDIYGTASTKTCGNSSWFFLD